MFWFFPMFKMWMATTWSLQLSAAVKLRHEPQDVADPAASVSLRWLSFADAGLGLCTMPAAHGEEVSSEHCECGRSDGHSTSQG